MSNQPTVCKTCGGAGKVRSQQGFFAVERECPTCHGLPAQIGGYESSLINYEARLREVTYDPQLKQQTLTSDVILGVGGNGMLAEDVPLILSNHTIAGPHGLELLEAVGLPDLKEPPKLTDNPSDWQENPRVQYERAKAFRDGTLQRMEEEKRKADENFSAIRQQCLSGNPEAAAFAVKLSHYRHKLHRLLAGDVVVVIDTASRVCLCEINIPAPTKLNFVKPKKFPDYTPVSATERKKLLETVLHSLVLRSAYLAALSDVANLYDVVAVNAMQSWVDPATGAERSGVVASLQATKDELASLKLDQVEPKACFQYLKGIATPSLDNASPIRPIFVLDKDDSRVVEGKDVSSEMAADTNLAAMPWEDFEHLVRQLFEWEFGKNGVEVKVTRASRDRGVDAIMFDPDPLRGGKYVLQAKRYTRTVDVAAVRDLYGTVMNEGANRGILVTTSSFGPDAYEFAKDKPISLVDGPNLVNLLRKHGKNYQVNLAAARSAGEV